MVKSIIIDENASLALNKLLNNEDQRSKTGLIIGSMDQHLDYITSVISTPFNESNQDESFNYDWFLIHALQIHDMLIGGCDILGVYTIDQSPSVSRQILTKMYKSLNEFDYYKQMKLNTERLVFLVDSKAKNINMKCLDLNEAASGNGKTFQACEIKVQKGLVEKEFFTLNSNFTLDSTFRTPNVKSHNLLKQDFLNALSTEDILNENKFVCLINNCLIDENKTLFESNSEFTDLDLYATLMENLSEGTKAEKKPENQENLDSIYELTGVCNLIVTFHKSYKLKHIKQLLAYDLMRSFNARVRLLVEDLDARKDIIGDVQLEDPNSNDVSSIEESYQTPNRIHIFLDESGTSGTHLPICDYVFPDETDEDISERVKELFSIEIVYASTQIVYVEDLPPEIRMSQSEDGNNKRSDSNSNLVKVDQYSDLDSNKGILGKGAFYVGSMLIAAASIAITYYSYIAASFLNDDSET